MEVVSAIVGPVGSVSTGRIKQKLKYLASYAEYVEQMRNRMQVLEYQSADIEEHMKENKVSNRKVPTHVLGWLEDVKKIKEDVDKISSNDIGCFDVKKKYRAGRNALRLCMYIERLIEESKIVDAKIPLGRIDVEIPLGRVDSKRLASTSGGGTQNLFKSRYKTFDDALKLLQQDDDDDDAARVIALCGMGGVGKTMLMKQLKEAAEDNKIFKWIVVVTIGNTPNLFSIQNAIAAHTGTALTETDKTLRATYLSKRFKGFLEHKEKILVILDDVWEKIKLEDIGLASPLPNGVKLLLTSRNENICQQIADDVDCVPKVVKVDVLEEEEARDFFSRIAGISKEHDFELYQIGCEIVKKCGGLPLAIKLIAATLKHEGKVVWKHTLKSLQNNNLDENIQEIIETSYKNLKREDKAIFLLCGMFPKHSNIPIEDLTRYSWGLKLLEQVSTMEAARDSIETSVSNLKKANLLMDGDSHHSDFVKLHNLVLAFVVTTVSKGEEGCWIINHDDFSKLSKANNMSKSCKRISLTCKGVSEFPSEFKFPNLTVLKLTQGDESVRFPQDFYVGMEKLQVIAFEKLKNPLVPTSFKFSSDLRTLCLEECLLTTLDLTCIGNLSNLEVLSFANSRIKILPSTFGNLKKLRLLDVTGCYYNLVIKDGVLKSLVKLEELYMIPYDEKTCYFTNNNSREFAERSVNLKRFKLSVGCSFTEVREHVQTYKVDMHSYGNSLKLVTNRKKLLKSKISELFKITDALYLQVNDMNTLEDVVVDPRHPQHPLQNSSFYNIRLLVVSQCAELKYLFTPSVATNLSKLDSLDISGCPNMEEVIHTENEGLDIIMFSNLKYLRLAELPKLLHFCNNVDVIEMSRLLELQLEGLPKFTSIYPDSATSFASSNISPTQSFLNKEDATPKLEKLFVKDCDSIEVLFNMDFREIEHLSSGLRSIKVDGCNRLMKLFSCNPFPLFNHLEELEVRYCASIEVIFDIDMRRVGETDRVSSSRLRSIRLWGLGKLREVWRIKDGGNSLIHGFEAVESIFIRDCERFENLITPATNIDLRALKEVEIKWCGRERERSYELDERNEDQEALEIINCKSMTEVFETQEINNKSGTDTGKSLPRLEYITMLELPKLKVLKIQGCNLLEHIFTFSTLESLTQLEELEVKYCKAMKVIVRKENEEQKTASDVVVFHHLKSLSLVDLPNVVGFFMGKNEFIWPALEKVVICECPQIRMFTYGQSTALKLKFVNTSLGKHSVEGGLNFHVTTTSHQAESTSSYRPMEWLPWSYRNLIEADMYNYNPGGGQSIFSSDKLLQLQKLETVHCSDCRDIEEIFDSQTDAEIPNLRQVDLDWLFSLKYIWKSKQGTVLKFPSLTRLSIEWCSSLEYVFTCPMVGSLLQLQELHISNCDSMKVIVKGEEEECDAIVNAIVFPCLKSLKLFELESLEGFCLGEEAFEFPSLDTVVITSCRKMTVLTKGDLSAPKLYAVSIQGV